MGPGLCLKQWTCDSTLLVIAFSQTNVMFSRSLNGSLVPISGVILAEWHRKSYVFHWAIASFYFSRSNWSTKVAWSLPRYKGYLPVYKHVHLCIAYIVKLVVKICAICKCSIRILNKLILYLYLLYIFIYTLHTKCTFPEARFCVTSMLCLLSTGPMISSCVQCSSLLSQPSEIHLCLRWCWGFNKFVPCIDTIYYIYTILLDNIISRHHIGKLFDSLATGASCTFNPGTLCISISRCG